MPDSDGVNLPNVLGYITRGVMKEFDVVQCALAVNPQQTPAGQNFEALLMVQSAYDGDVDVHVRLLFPAQDVKGERGRFFTKTDRILLGLEPAEVGVVRLPISCSPLTAQAIDYRLGVELKVSKQGRGERVRDRQGGAAFDPADMLNEKTAARIDALRRLAYSDRTDRRGRLIAAFDLIAPTGPSLGLNLAPEWESLWTMRDHMDAQVVIEKAGALAQQVLPNLNRNRVFMPLMKTVQARYARAGYPLHAGEALYIAKLLTLVLENGVSSNPDVPPPHWYVRLCRLLYADQRSGHNVEHLVTELLWDDLIVDATTLAFSMIAVVTRQQLLGDAEAEAYGFNLVERLSAEKPAMDFPRVYVPLVMGGLVANTRVVLEREQVLDSVHALDQALDKRRPEMNEYNKEVFDMTEALINRALDMF
ncbi:MAG: hypothetical protein Kow00120_02900 [Anaerolineae bacterium]